MKSILTRRTLGRGIILAIVVFAFAALSIARTLTTSVNIVNNSSRAISHVYLSHVGADDWTGNQIGESVIASGQSYNMSNVACDQQQVKVIAEDQDGCFMYTTVEATGNPVWTITSDTTRNCGG